MNKPWHYGKCNKIVTKNIPYTIWFYLFEIPKVVKFRDEKQNGVSQGLGRGGIGELLFNKYKVSVLQGDGWWSWVVIDAQKYECT